MFPDTLSEFPQLTTRWVPSQHSQDQGSFNSTVMAIYKEDGALALALGLGSFVSLPVDPPHGGRPNVPGVFGEVAASLAIWAVLQ